jgi:transcriptional regulator with XRE-family HTH domain
MITGRQIRAARSLLDWTAADLAEKAGLTRETVSRIEVDTVQAREGSLEKLLKVFDVYRIEFIDNQGVRFKANDIEVFEGVERFHDFTEFVYEHLLRNGGEVCVSAVDENLFRKYRKDVELYRKRMQELVARGDVTVRVLATESIFTSAWAQFKWQPEQSSVPTSFYAFGECLALISFAHEPPPYVVLLKSGPFAEAYRHAFNIAWANAKEPPKPGAKS